MSTQTTLTHDYPNPIPLYWPTLFTQVGRINTVNSVLHRMGWSLDFRLE